MASNNGTRDAAQQILSRVDEAAQDVEALANALADRLRRGGDFAVRASGAVRGATYGAAAGARAGAAAAGEIPAPLKYAGIAILAYLLLRR